MNYVSTKPQCYDSIVSYKIGRGLPTAEPKQKRVKQNEHWFVINQGKLYKKSFSLPLLRCVSAKELQRIIEDIHERWEPHWRQNLSFEGLKGGIFLANHGERFAVLCEEM